MDPSSDSSLSFRHQHHQGQRQRLGPSQPTGNMSSPSSSHAPNPASPPTSTAASSNPFVRSHHDDLPAPEADNRPSTSESHHFRQRSVLDTERSSRGPSRTASSSSSLDTDELFVAIKCPSLDQDSALVKVKLADTVFALKQTIEATWAGAPRASGMRCIRSGQILSDTEVLGRLSEKLEQGEPLSLHIVIRPDAWSDPQNRPTPSRRGSLRRLQHQRSHSLLRSALIPPHNVVDDDVPPSRSTTSTEHPPHWTPTFEPYFSEPDALPTQSSSAIDADLVASSSEMVDRATEVGGDAYGVLEETLCITAPQNWPLLVEALGAACDEYVLLYERIYEESQAAQQPSSAPGLPTTAARSLKQSDLLRSVETTLLGWDPVPVPIEDGNADSVTGQGTEYLYHQISHRGLPYLLRVETTPLATQRSEALYILLQRITTLRAMGDKLENIIMLGRLVQVQSANLTPSGPQTPPQVNAAGRALPLEGGLIATLSRASQTVTTAFREITFADVSAIVVPLFFVGFKVGILLSVMLRGAEPVKKYFVLGMASMYVVFESYRIVRGRMRMRRRARPVPRPDAPAPMGANVPVAPAHEDAVERQASEDPMQPLPPPQSPIRNQARRYTYDWWMNRLAFLGLDVEDSELGLSPHANQPRRQPDMSDAVLTWTLPLVLFVVTMMPAVEQRRKRAIEDRERVIRKWIRLEEERRQRMDDLRKQADPSSIPAEHPLGHAERELQGKRVEYADRILRQRRTTEAVDLDDEQPQDPVDEADMQDMNIF